MIDLRILFVSMSSFFASGSENSVELQKNTAISTCQKIFDKNLNIDVYSVVTKIPSFPGGPAGWQRFLAKNFQYPKDQITNETYQTSSIATFIVKSSGELTSLSIKGKSFSQWTSLDSSFIAVIKKSGRWVPGECDGKIVATFMEQPLNVDIER